MASLFATTMKKLFLLIPFAGLLAGCNTTIAKITRPDGSTFEVTNRRAIWSTDAYAVKLGDAELTVTKSSPDAATAQAIAQGVATGLKK